MAERRIVKSRNKEVYPVTHEECVVDNKATSISERFQTKGSITIPNELNALETKIGSDGSSHSLITQLNAIGGRYSEIIAELVEILQSLGMEPTSEDLDVILEEVKSYSTTTFPNHAKLIRMTMMPSDAKHTGIALAGDVLYVIGGYTTTAVRTTYAYTLDNNSHATKATMAATRYYINACYLSDGRIYIPGGYNGSSAQKTNYGYSVSANVWDTRAELPAGRYGSTAFSYNGNTMYVVGGYGYSEVISYNCTQNTWTTQSSVLPKVLCYSTSTLIGSKAYIMGGFNTSSSSSLRDCYCYDLAINTISTKASLPATVENSSSALIKGKIYVFGGGSNTTSIYTYDPVLNSWSTSSNVLPLGMIGSRAVSYNDDVAIIQYGRYVYLYRP